MHGQSDQSFLNILCVVSECRMPSKPSPEWLMRYEILMITTVSMAVCSPLQSCAGRVDNCKDLLQVNFGLFIDSLLYIWWALYLVGKKIGSKIELRTLVCIRYHLNLPFNLESTIKMVSGIHAVRWAIT